ncbi:MAG: cofactor-independent phosphoglycerate mutase [Nitrospirae bacterium]|nr:cofactor-independent phosphoglycerate mutase [Candidatus Manganitrophaceae bacterium]
MKYIVLVANGMADRSLPALDGRTPLEAARTPHIDLLAASAEIGQVQTIPEGFMPGSDVANLSILGYDPRQFYPGRGALESAGMEVHLNEGDVAFCCNLVTLRDRQKEYAFSELSPRVFLEDPSGGGIEDDEARELIDLLNNLLGSDQIQFYVGRGYRHLMVWAHGAAKVECLPPQRLVGREIIPSFPRGADKGILKKLVQSVFSILSEHPINEARIARGERPANAVWFWGPGKARTLPSFSERFAKRGAMVSAVDLLRGLGRRAGMKVIDLPGAAGGADTPHAGEVAAADGALKAHDLVYLHFQSSDEARPSGDPRMKVEAIERFDAEIVGPLLSRLKERGPWRLLLLPDHATLVSTRDPVADPVPFLLCRGLEGGREGRSFSEKEAARSSIFWSEGHRLIDYFLKG